jgi:hypothetical protein
VILGATSTATMKREARQLEAMSLASDVASTKKPLFSFV